MKVCNVCRTAKPVEDFSVRRASKDGRSYTCKSCSRERLKQRYKSNKDQYKKAAADWAKSHPEQRREILTRSQAKRVEVGRKTKNRWRKDDPERARLAYQKAARIRRERLSSGNFTREEWNSILEKYRHTCLGCRRSEPDVRLVPDHVVPVSRSGQHAQSNIQPLCHQCNGYKALSSIDYRPFFGIPMYGVSAEAQRGLK